MKGSFWWRRLLKLINTYKGIAQANLDLGGQSCFGVTCGMGKF
jgi:hypothetical protein